MALMQQQQSGQLFDNRVDVTNSGCLQVKVGSSELSSKHLFSILCAESKHPIWCDSETKVAENIRNLFAYILVTIPYIINSAGETYFSGSDISNLNHLFSGPSYQFGTDFPGFSYIREIDDLALKDMVIAMVHRSIELMIRSREVGNNYHEYCQNQKNVVCCGLPRGDREELFTTALMSSLFFSFAAMTWQTSHEFQLELGDSFVATMLLYILTVVFGSIACFVNDYFVIAAVASSYFPSRHPLRSRAESVAERKIDYGCNILLYCFDSLSYFAAPYNGFNETGLYPSLSFFVAFVSFMFRLFQIYNSQPGPKNIFTPYCLLFGFLKNEWGSIQVARKSLEPSAVIAKIPSVCWRYFNYLLNTFYVIFNLGDRREVFG